MTKGRTAGSPAQSPVESGAADAERPSSGSAPGTGRRPGASTGTGSPPEPARADVRARRPGWRRVLRVLVPLVCAALAGGGAAAYAAAQQRSFASEALVAVLPTEAGADVSPAYAAIWVEIGNSGALLAQAATELGISEQSLVDSVTIAQAGEAALLSIEVTTGDSDRSARWANGVAARLIARSEAAPVSDYELQQVATAVPARASAGIPPVPAAVAAGLVGLAIGVAVVRAWARHRRRSAGRERRAT